jgi:hypothetical protein
MLFDPPQIGYVITSFKELKDRMEYRLNRAREDIVHPMEPKASPLREDVFADPIIIDGGDWDG